MKTRANWLIVFSFCCSLCLVRADEFKPGSAFPTNRVSKMDLPLSAFINQKSLVTDWSLVVLLRGEKYYILSDKANRELLSKPPAQGDMVVLDEAATSFLSWRRQNPETESTVFWKANPKLREQTIRYTSSATEGASSTSSNAESDPPETQASQPSITSLPIAHPATAKKPHEPKPQATTSSKEPTSSTPWSIIVVLIVAAVGLLWLLLKRRS